MAADPPHRLATDAALESASLWIWQARDRGHLGLAAGKHWKKKKATNPNEPSPMRIVVGEDCCRFVEEKVTVNVGSFVSSTLFSPFFRLSTS